MAEGNEMGVAQQTVETAAAAKRTKEPAGTEYVVLMQREVTLDEPSAWEEIAKVTVAPRSHRRSAVAPALADAGIAPQAGQRFRVLDEDAASVLTAREKAPVTPTMEFV